MPRFSVTSPDGRTIEVTAPEGATEQDAIQYAQDNWSSLSAAAPQRSVNPLEAAGAGLVGGLGSSLLGTGAAIADYAGADDTAGYLDEKRNQVQAFQQEHGGDTTTGKIASMVGGLAPALAMPEAGILSWLANGALFALPGFRDSYKEQLDSGASKEVAAEHGLANAGFALVGGKLISTAGKALPKALQAGEGLVPQLAQAAGEGAAFDAASGATNKGIDVANGRQTDAPWIDPAAMAQNAAAFSILRGAHHAIDTPNRNAAQAAKDAADTDAAKADADAQAKTDADAAAQKDTPEYAQKFVSDYEALQQERLDLQQTLRANATKKTQPDYHVQAAANKETGMRLADVNAQLQEQVPEYTRAKALTPEETAVPETAPEIPALAVPEVTKDTATQVQPDMFGAADTTGTPEVAAPEVDPQARLGELQQQIRMLGGMDADRNDPNSQIRGLLQEHEAAADAATTPEDIARTARQVQQTQKALNDATTEFQTLYGQQKAAPTAPVAPPIIAQYKRLVSRMNTAKDNGDWATAERLANKAVAMNADGSVDTATQDHTDAAQEFKDVAAFAKAAPVQTEITAYKTPSGSESKESFGAPLEAQRQAGLADMAAKEAQRTRPAELPTDVAEQGNLFAGENIAKGNAPGRAEPMFFVKGEPVDTAPTETTPAPATQPLASQVVKGVNESTIGGPLSIRTDMAQAQKDLNTARALKDRQGASDAIDRLRDLQEKLKTPEPVGTLSEGLAATPPASISNEQDASARRADVMSQYGVAPTGQVHRAAVNALTSEISAITGRGLTTPEKQHLMGSVGDVFRANPLTDGNTQNIGSRVNDQLTALRSDFVNARPRPPVLEAEHTTVMDGPKVQDQIDRLRADPTTTPETHDRLNTLEDNLPKFGDPVSPDAPTMTDVNRYLTQGARSEDWAPLGEHIDQQQRMGLSDSAQNWVTGKDEIVSASQSEIPQARNERLQGTVFSSPIEFDSYLRSEALHKLRAASNEHSVAQTMSRAQERIAPLQAAAADLKESLGWMQTMRDAAQKVVPGNISNAKDALARAETKLAGIQSKLESELALYRSSLSNIDADWKSTSGAANDVSRQIEANLQSYAGPEAAAYAKLQQSREAVQAALSKDVNKTNWDRLRTLQQRAVEATHRWLEEDTHRNATLTDYVRRDMRLQRELSEQVSQMVELHNNRARVEEALREAQAAQKRRVLSTREMPAAQSERDLAANALARTTEVSKADLTKRDSEIADKQSSLDKYMAEIEVEMGPVQRAQERRVNPPEDSTERAAHDAVMQRRAKTQQVQEHLDALPGERVTHEAYRNALDKLEEAPARLLELHAAVEKAQQAYDAKIQLPDAKKNSKTTLNEAKRKLADYQQLMTAASKLLSNTPEARAAAMEHLSKARSDVQEKVAHQRAAVAENNTPARREALKRAVTTMRQISKFVNAISETSAQRTEISSKVDRENEAAFTHAFERGGMADKLKTEGSTGKLDPRLIGVVARKATNPGDFRTGDATVTEQNRTGSRNPPREVGRRRGETSTQAVRNANADTEVMRIEDALEKIAQNSNAVADKLDAAMSAGDEAAVDKYTGFAERLDHAKSIYEEQLAALQPKGRTETAVEDASPRKLGDGSGTLASVDTRNALHDGDTQGMLAHLLNETTSTEERDLLNSLAPHLEGVKISVTDELRHEGAEVAGLYHEGANRIEMHPDRLTREDITHELTHAATATVLNTPDNQLAPHQVEAKKGLTGMWEQMKNNPAFKGEYAIKNVKEFASEVFSNPHLREKMDSIGKPQSLLQRFTTFVARLFGGGRTESEKAIAHIKDILSPARMQYMNAETTPGLFTRTRSAPANDAEKFGRDIRGQRTALETLKNNKESAALLFEQKAVDMRASLRQALRLGDAKSGMQALYMTGMMDNVTSATQAAASHGALGFSKDQKGYTQVTSGHSKSLEDTFKSIKGIPGKDAEAKMSVFQAGITALRARDVGWDKLDFKDAKQAQIDGEAALKHINSDPAMKAAFDKARDVYREYNHGMIKFLMETHAVDEALGKKMLADKNYIPFFRESGDSLMMVMPEGHPVSMGDIRSQPFLAALKGGDQKLMKFEDAAFKNTAMLTSLALRNVGTTQIAYHLQDIGKKAGVMQIQRGKGGAGADVIRFRQKPDPNRPQDDGWRHITIDTKGTAAEHIPSDLLAQSVAGSYATLPSFLNVATYASDILRAGITRNPMYVVRQLFKDSINASMLGNLKSNPVEAALKSVGSYAGILQGKNADANLLASHGVGHSNVFNGSKSDLTRAAEQLAGKPQSMLRNGLAYLDKMAMSADATVRAQHFRDAKNSGASDVEAVVGAREMQNFSKHGSSANVQFLSRAIPFFNASIQGLSVAAKAVRGRNENADLMGSKKAFYNRAMGMAGMAVTYAMMMQDDPDWQAMSLRDKLNYIHIPKMLTGTDQSMRLPAPFETGAAFYSLPVALVESMRGGFTKSDWDAVKDVFLNQMPGSANLTPQIAKGIYDVRRNYNSGMDMPIETAGMTALTPDARFNAKTTEAAKAFSKHLVDAGVKLSPVQLEYLSNAYLGGLPVAIAAMTNNLFASASAGARPEGHSADRPILGTLFQNDKGGEFASKMYDQATELTQAKKTLDSYLKQGDMSRAREFMQEHRKEIALQPMAADYSKMMGQFKQQEMVIRNHPQMPGEVKQARLDSLDARRSQLSKQFNEALTRMKQKLELSAG